MELFEAGVFFNLFMSVGFLKRLLVFHAGQIVRSINAKVGIEYSFVVDRNVLCAISFYEVATLVCHGVGS